MAIGERRPLDAPPGSTAPERWRTPVPLVGGAIIAICALVYVGEIATNYGLENAWALVPRLAREGQWYRTLTCIVTHGGLLHVVMNMSVVWTLGFALERAISGWRFALISLVTALGSSTFVMLFANPDQATVGASGMILGYAGAILPIATREGRRAIGTWLVQIAVISLLPFVSWQGHLGGLLFGLPCGLLLRARAKYFGVGMPLLIAAAAGALAISIHVAPIPLPSLWHLAGQ